MADKKISALTGASTPLAGTEVLPIVQGGATVKVAVSNLTAGRTVAMLGYTSSADSIITSANAAGGAGLFVKNTGDAPALTQYSYVNFSTGSDDGQSSVRSYRTNPGVDYQTRLAFFVNPSGATHVPIQAFNAESDGVGGTRFNIIGNLSVLGVTTTTKVSTLEGTSGTIANNATATLFTLPAVGSYLVTVRQAGGGNGTIRASAIVTQGSSTNATSALSGVACTLSSGTGFNVSLTNSAGGDAVFTWSYVKLAA